MKVVRTPLRISFFGGGTDYPEWFNKHGGEVFGIAINRYCYVNSHNNKFWESFDLPKKSGMATSSAFTVGLLKSTTNLDSVGIAELAIKLEREKSGGNVGCQDQYLCALGGSLHLKFSEDMVNVERIDTDTSFLSSHLMLVYVGQRHLGNYGEIEEQLSNMKQNKPILTEMQSMVGEGIKSIGREDFGLLLHHNWELKRKLGDHVSSSAIDAIYEKARQAGALGGKVMGAGGGGFLLLYAPPEKHQFISQQIAIEPVKFAFEPKGTEVIYDSASESQSQD